MRQMSPVCKMADNGRLTVDQKVKAVLSYAETKSVVATQRCFRAHFCIRWALCKQTIYRLSLGTIFQPMRINSVPDVKCFCKNKNVLCVQSMVWHFVSHPVIRCNGHQGIIICFWTALCLKRKAIRNFEKFGNNDPATQRSSFKSLIPHVCCRCHLSEVTEMSHVQPEN